MPVTFMPSIRHTTSFVSYDEKYVRIIYNNFCFFRLIDSFPLRTAIYCAHKNAFWYYDGCALASPNHALEIYP
jgi:hypothetical protein